MTKLHKKLLVFLSVMVCSLCLCFGLAACNFDNGDTNDDDGHTHTFAGAWLYDGAEGHYQLATCHPTVKSALEDHFDNDEDGECDACGFDMSNEDGGHEHTYAEEWTFNENMHWHNATCGHFLERSDYDDHSFVEGVCECGVKESEVKVYELYKTSPEYELYFPQWLQWLKEHNVVSVEYTESGDGIYHYEDGHKETRFLGERTVKVKAVKDGKSLADVWFMVAMYQTAEEGYYESKGTIALGIAKTDSTGVAEITFRPVGGYSSETIEYRIRIAEKKDIAVFEGVAEAQASRPFPNRHSVKGGAEGFEYAPYEVSENTTSDDIAATIEFEYSAGWNAYNTIELPYKRYYEDLINGENIKEDGKTYQFTSSGYNLFDYFVLTPAKYSLKGASTTEENDKIVANAKLAASGIYTVTFAVDRNATAVLYYWNEQGVNLGAFHFTNQDGTPSDRYVTEKTEGDINYVTVKITPALGLRYYQFGIKTDIQCNVTLTVERLADLGPDATFEWDNETQKSVVNVAIPQDDTLFFGLDGVPAGLYSLQVGISTTWSPEIFYAYTDTDENKVAAWTPISITGVTGPAKAVIKITEETNYIYLQNTGVGGTSVAITLEKYELPTVTAGEFSAVPVSTTAMQETYVLPLNAAADTYKLKVCIGGKANGGADYPLSVYIGDTLYTLENPSVHTTQNVSYYTYSGEVTVGENDNTISIICSTPNAFTAGVKIAHECNNVCPECNKCLTDCEKPECAEKCSGHDEPDFDGEKTLATSVTIEAGQTCHIVSSIDGRSTILNPSGAPNQGTVLKQLGIEAGTYYIVAETDSDAVSGNLTLQKEIGGGIFNCDMYSPLTKQYKGIYTINDSTKTISIVNNSDSAIVINTLKIVEYSAPVIEQAGVEYEIPASNLSDGVVAVMLDESFAGKTVKITISNWDPNAGSKRPAIWDGINDDIEIISFKSSNKVTDGVFEATCTIPEGTTALWFQNTVLRQNRMIIVKIEIVES